MLAHAIRGTGHQDVVLLHGFLGMGRNLASVARLWAAVDEDKRFILPDLLGHGTSPPLPSAPTLLHLGEALVALLRQLHRGAPYHLVGHSLGGRVALQTCALAPEMVSAVTLLDIEPGPTAATDPHGPSRLVPILLSAPKAVADRASMRKHFTDRGVPGALSDWLLMNLARRDGSYVWRIGRRALATLAQSSQKTDLWPLLPQLRCRVHCIRGERSTFVSDDVAARMVNAGIPVETIADAGHFLHVDQPVALNERLCRL